MTALVWLCIVLTVALTGYSLGHYLIAMVFLVGRRQARQFSEHPDDAVAVLVPARNEGEGALRVIESLLRQDHAGLVEVHLLLKDAQDSSIPFLEEAFPGASLDVAAPAEIELSRAEGRVVFVSYTGSDPKAAKVNWQVERLSTAFMAILDCDHQADPDWIRSSVCLLHEQGARIIQGRRRPLSARGVFQLWDSLHQHIGCELSNHAFTRLGLTVFFTGTTVVMDTALLRSRPLKPCITEDIDLSYSLLQQGIPIIHNPHSGSDEEVSPDLYSFLARRRRWANGHTDAFFRHLVPVVTAPIALKSKLQFLFHGVHYLVSLVVFVLHLLIGLIFVQQLSTVGAAAAVAATLLLGAMIARTQRTLGWGTWVSEVAVAFGWMFPALVIVMNLGLAFVLNDGSRAALPIPYVVQGVGLVGLVAPVVVLLVGLLGFRTLSPGTLLAVVITYPLAFYLDICGVLIGLTDYLAGRERWHAVARAPQPASAHGRVALTVAMGLEESWRLGSVLAAAPGALLRGSVALSRPRRLVPAVAVLGLLCAGVVVVPVTGLQVADVACEVLEHDSHPWIVPATELDGFCGPKKAGQSSTWTARRGSYEVLRDDALTRVDPGFWDQLDTTFPCNLSKFDPANVVVQDGGGVHLRLEQRDNADRDYSSASIATKASPDAQHLYGRFETVLKPARVPGVITAFFLYRFDPWQEVDFEFLGRDTTRVMVNVYYNPGEEGDLFNYGYRGTPVLIDLGFDAADDFHTYAIEWDPDEIRWFVDDQLIHHRKSGRPTPIPHLPMRFHVNVWPICSEELAGTFDPSKLPSGADIQRVSIARWTPAADFSSFRDLLSDEPADWRAEADWIQP